MAIAHVRHARAGLAVLMLPTLFVSMDMFVLQFAVPHVSADLRPSAAELLWIVDVYGFMVAGALVTMGTLGDRIGRRRILLIAAAVFAAASVLAAFSVSSAMLVVARALLGIAGAGLLPSALGLVRALFADQRERAIAIGIFVAVFTCGGAIGPLVGGAMLGAFWWGAAFLLAVPAMAVTVGLGRLLLPEAADPAPGRLDLASAALSIVAVLAVVFGLKRIATGEADPLAAAAVVVGLAFGAAFWRRQRRLTHPLLDLALFRVPTVGLALLAQLTMLAAWSGTYLFIAQHLQLVAGLSPLVAGLWTLPGVAAGVVAAMLVPRLRLRPAPMLATLLAGAAAGCLVLGGAGAGLVAVIVGAALINAMTSALVAVGTDLIVGAAPEERAGVAASLSETSTELGLALGVAVLGSAGAAAFRAALPGADTLGAAIQAQPDAARAAFLDGMHVAAWLGAVALGCAAAVALVRAAGGRIRQ